MSKNRLWVYLGEKRFKEKTFFSLRTNRSMVNILSFESRRAAEIHWRLMKEALDKQTFQRRRLDCWSTVRGWNREKSSSAAVLSMFEHKMMVILAMNFRHICYSSTMEQWMQSVIWNFLRNYWHGIWKHTVRSFTDNARLRITSWACFSQPSSPA